LPDGDVKMNVIILILGYFAGVLFAIISEAYIHDYIEDIEFYNRMVAMEEMFNRDMARYGGT